MFRINRRETVEAYTGLLIAQCSLSEALDLIKVAEATYGDQGNNALLVAKGSVSIAKAHVSQALD